MFNSTSAYSKSLFVAQYSVAVGLVVATLLQDYFTDFLAVYFRVGRQLLKILEGYHSNWVLTHKMLNNTGIIPFNMWTSTLVG